MSLQDENSNEDVLASTSSTTSVDNSKQKVKEKPIVKANSKRRERKRVEKEKKRGIIYLARIPRDVQPAQIRQLLKEHAEINRLYLKPRILANGKKARGRPQYSEGWVEFNDKRRARMIADMLNNEPMGVGKKKKFYSAELWSMKYLSKFSWHDLTLKLAQQKAIEQKRLRVEKHQAKKDAEFFTEQVRKAKKSIKQQERKNKRKASHHNDDADADEEDEQQNDASTSNNESPSTQQATSSSPRATTSRKKRKTSSKSDGFQLFAPVDASSASKSKHADLLAASRSTSQPRANARSRNSNSDFDLIAKLAQ